MDSVFSFLKIYRILLSFLFPSYILILNNYLSKRVLQSSLFLYARLCLTKNGPKVATYIEFYDLLNNLNS